MISYRSQWIVWNHDLSLMSIVTHSITKIPHLNLINFFNIIQSALHLWGIIFRIVPVILVIKWQLRNWFFIIVQTGNKRLQWRYLERYFSSYVMYFTTPSQGYAKRIQVCSCNKWYHPKNHFKLKSLDFIIAYNIHLLCQINLKFAHSTVISLCNLNCNTIGQRGAKHGQTEWHQIWKQCDILKDILQCSSSQVAVNEASSINYSRRPMSPCLPIIVWVENPMEFEVGTIATFW